MRRTNSGEIMGRLTTHILDTANGIPAANVDIHLYALFGNLNVSALSGEYGERKAKGVCAVLVHYL